MLPYLLIAMQLKDAVIVITGASRGLGLEMARAFKSKGAKLVLAARSPEIKEATASLGAAGFDMDVTDEKSVSALAAKAVEMHGRIDLWINNAGIWIPHAPIEQTDWKRVHDMVEVNLFGTVYGSKAALIQMRKQKGGVILNILSTSALEGRPGSSGYCASKYAAVGFTKSLRLEAKPDIKVIAAYPGGMRTSFFDEKKPENYNEYMDPKYVVEKIVANLELADPQEELIIKKA
jgi:NAD(P)-dependent dehydrogenase (short-subunit alcohol dehydrogenase family)